jgi:hypothetical protein
MSKQERATYRRANVATIANQRLSTVITSSVGAPPVSLARRAIKITGKDSTLADATAILEHMRPELTTMQAGNRIGARRQRRSVE